MKTIILAGGKGKRLAPYTTVFPKPLMPIGQKPILDIILQQLMYYGFRDVVLSVGYLSELIHAYFAGTQDRFFTMNLSYIREKKPLGTAGSLKLIDGLEETFMVMNGDVLTTLDYARLVEYHRSRNAALTIAMYKKHVKIDLGVLETDQQGVLTGYHEKPQKDYSVSMGVYVYEPRVLEYIETNRYLDFPDLVARLLAAGEKVVGFPFDGYWLDIGRPEDYEKAHHEFIKAKALFLPSTRLTNENLKVPGNLVHTVSAPGGK